MRKGWCIDREVWRRRRATLSVEVQWKTVLFARHHAHQVPTRPGVYVIAAPPPCVDGKPHASYTTPMYVGQASNSLRERFQSHTGPNCQPSVQDLHELYAGDRVTLYFQYAVLAPELVPTAESLLIDCYGPPANRIRGVRLKDGVPAG